MRTVYALWKYFLKHAAEGYCQSRGITVKEIKRIGINKFIKANDWRSSEDIDKWEEDKVFLAVCPQCHQDFGLFLDDRLGLCEKCVVKFDLNNFYKELNEVLEKADEEHKLSISGQATVLFYADKVFRKRFLKEDSANAK